MSHRIARGHGRCGVTAAALRTPRFGIARILSKRGICSRSEAARWVQAGRVSVDGRVVHDPEFPCDPRQVRIALDGRPLSAAAPVYVMLNKPRGLVTTAADERGRDTVYTCLDGLGAAWIAPVGRLDKASEGLLLFSNDPAWAAAIADPAHGPAKIYHVHVDGVPDKALFSRLVAGVETGDETLRAASVTLLRQGARRAWLEIVLEQGRNRQIRRMLAACQLDVLRLVRVAIGPLVLGELPKGQWRCLSPEEAAALAPVAVTV